MAFYRSLRKLAETNPLKKARLFFQLPAVEPFLRSHRRFRRAAPTLHAQIASPFLMVRPSPRTSIPLFSTLETAPVRDASSLARKQRVLRKVKALSVRLMWRDFAYSKENHVKPLLELTNPQHKDFCFSMECLWLTPFELSTEAPPHVSSSSNQYL
uniref:Uncharacterized protein n=1 Tax=Brassica oleracea var. oleracea TaxID=109376 RepID=A0A0D3A203_BRAOL